MSTEETYDKEAADKLVAANKASDELPEEVSTDPLDNPEINQAAKVFMQGLPRVKSFAANMKGGALGRVFNAVMEFPLGQAYPKFRSKTEHELFIMSLSLLKAKNMMVSAIGQAEQQKQAAAEAAIKQAAEAVTADAVQTTETTEVAQGESDGK